MNKAIENTAREVARQIAEHGWCAWPAFVARAEVATLRTRLRAWWEEGELRRAGIGRGENFQVREDIRGDHVRWLDFSVGGAFSDLIDAYYEPLRLAVNRELQLGLFEFEGHVAVYPPGAFYKRHVDRFRDATQRKLSVVLYLNEPGWLAEDGGQLRLFLPAENGERIVDVLPEGGTLAAFLSHDIAHEVLPARRERFSLTGWFRTRG